MPGIRFADVRARVTMSEVLGLISFASCETSGDQVRGPCPVHRSAKPLRLISRVTFRDIS
jgi:hypothetical protein